MIPIVNIIKSRAIKLKSIVESVYWTCNRYAFKFLLYYFLLYSDASEVDLCSFGAHLAMLLNEGPTNLLGVLALLYGLSLASQVV